MPGDSTRTINHDEIRAWIESRHGRPATVADAHRNEEKAGLLRVDMPGGPSNPHLEPLSWEDFFARFDDENLAFIYQDETAAEESPFCKFVSRRNDEMTATFATPKNCSNLLSPIAERLRSNRRTC
jgi:hypothetical protein